MADYRSLIEKAAFGVPGRWESLPRYGDGQQQVLGRSLERGERMLDNPYAGFEPIKQDVLRSFKEDVLPSIANRIGSIPGGRFSTGASGLYQTAERDLAQRLAGLQSQYGLQQQQLGQQQLGMGLSQLQDYYPVAAQRGLAQEVGPQIASGVAQAVPQVVGKGVEMASEFLPAGFQQLGKLAGKGVSALGDYFTGAPGPSPQVMRDMPTGAQSDDEYMGQWLASEAEREGIDRRRLGVQDYWQWYDRKTQEWNQALQQEMARRRAAQEQQFLRSPEGIMQQKARGTYAPTISERFMDFARRFRGG